MLLNTNDRLFLDLSKPLLATPPSEQLPGMILEGALTLLDGSAACLILEATPGESPALSRTGAPVPIFGHDAAAQAVATGSPVRLDGPEEWVVAAPLQAFGMTLGVLVAKGTGHLPDDRLHAMNLWCPLAAAALAFQQKDRDQQEIGARIESTEKQLDAALGLYDLYEEAQRQADEAERRIEAALSLYDLYEEAQLQAMSAEKRAEAALSLYDLYEEAQAQAVSAEKRADAALGLYDLYEEAYRQAEEARDIAFKDALTGTATKAFFTQRLDQEVAESQRYGHPLSLLLIDLDFFKHINDAYGHQAGDQALQVTGAILRDCIRTSDLAARFGGEEFAIVLPHTEEDGAFILAERIRQRVEAAEIASHLGVTFKLTTSIGLATLRHHMTSPKDLIEEADQALYRAKKAGRNRTCINSEEPLSLEVAQSMSQQGKETLFEIAQALCMAMEAKDAEIGRHGRAVAHLAREFGTTLGLPAERIEALYLAGLLHDVGKIAIPEALLKAPEASLTDDDRRLMNRHSVTATALLNRIRGFAPMREAVLYHHERLDGTGFPEGLKGDQIPMAARILSICNAYDILLHPSHGHPARTEAEARETLLRLAGSAFDPDLIRRFLDQELPTAEQLTMTDKETPWL
ncbi:MAG TPA: diguanylate cyclase [Stenomitos sp.]